MFSMGNSVTAGLLLALISDLSSFPTSPTPRPLVSEHWVFSLLPQSTIAQGTEIPRGRDTFDFISNSPNRAFSADTAGT